MVTVSLSLLNPMSGASNPLPVSRIDPSLDPIRHLRVMTFNIRHAKGMDGKVDLSRVAGAILKADADVVALQEVDRYQPRSGFQNQVKRLAARLGMHDSFSPSIDLGFMQYGNAILSKYPIDEKRVAFMNGIAERRSLLIAKIRLDGQEVTIANTHLGVLEKEREKQIPLLNGILNGLEQPAILCGDFNISANDTRLKQIGSRWSKVKLRKKQSTVHHGGEIDHIFVSLPNAKSSAWVEKTDASDHHPVIADIEWINKP